MSISDDKLREILANSKLPLIGEFVYDASANDVYIQVDWSTHSDGRRATSRSQLLKAKELFIDIGLKLHIQLVSKVREEFETLLRGTLFLAFPDLLRNVFCSNDPISIFVWIEPKQHISEELKILIERSAGKFCETQGMNLTGLALLGEANTPGKIAILSTLRTMAPAKIEDLFKGLQGKEFTMPSLDWLSRRLDIFRKSDDVIFTSEKMYALTIDGLRALGTSKTGSRSPDVSRLLAVWRNRR